MIEKKYRTNVILCLVGLLFVGLTVASAILFGRLRDRGWEEAISLEEIRRHNPEVIIGEACPPAEYKKGERG